MLLVRRVRLDPEQVSADPRSRRRRTLHPDQRALPIPELEQEPAIYAYSFICTNLDVSTPARAAAVEHWYRHRTSAENIFRDSKHGAALRHLPSGYEQVNTAWMWASLIAAAVAAWLHQLTGLISGGELVEGHGTRGGKAMIATLRRRLIAVPARLVSHGGQLIMRLAPGAHLLPGILATIRALPAPAADHRTSTTRDREAITGTQTPGHGPRAPDQQKDPAPAKPGATTGPLSCPHAGPDSFKIIYPAVDNGRRSTRGFGSDALAPMTGIPVVLTIPAGIMVGGWIRRKDQRPSDKADHSFARDRPAVPPAVTRPTDRRLLAARRDSQAVTTRDQMFA